MIQGRIEYELTHNQWGAKYQVAFYNLFYCSLVYTGGLFLIIVRLAKRSGVYLTL